MCSIAILATALVMSSTDGKGDPAPEPLPNRYRVSERKTDDWFAIDDERLLVGSRWAVFAVKSSATHGHMGVVSVELSKGVATFVPCPEDGKLWRCDLIPIDDVCCAIAVYPRTLGPNLAAAMLWEWNLDKGQVSATVPWIDGVLSAVTAVDRSAHSITWSLAEDQQSADTLTITHRANGRKFEAHVTDFSSEAVFSVASGNYGKWFLPGDHASMFIVCDSPQRSKPGSLSCIDLRDEDRNEWSLCGQGLRDALGFAPISITPLMGQYRPCSRIAVAVEPTDWATSWGILVVDVNTGTPVGFYPLGQNSNDPSLAPGPNPVISRNGRYVIFKDSKINVEKKEVTECYGLLDLERKIVTHHTIPNWDFAIPQTFGIADNRYSHASDGRSIFSFDIHSRTAWEPTEVFCLRPEEATESE